MAAVFERFSAEARDMLLTAQEEARSLGHDHIGTEHLLIALTASDSAPVRTVLGPYGLTPEGVRAQVIEVLGPCDVGAPGNIPFTPRSKKVLELSLREALKLKHKAIEPGHLLLGLIREGEGLATRILTEHTHDLERLRAEVLAQLGSGRRWNKLKVLPAPSLSVPSMTRGGVAAFSRARKLADGGPVGSQHLLLGLLAEEDTLAARALSAIGVTRRAVEEELAAIDPTATPDELPEHVAARHTRLEIDRDVVTVRLEDPDLAAKLKAARADQDRPVVILGTEVPDFERFWRSVRPALEAVGTGFSKRMIERGLPSVREPEEVGMPGERFVARYTVTSTPDGLRGGLDIDRRIATEDEVRTFLRAWLADFGSSLAGHSGPHRETGCVRLELQVGRPGEVRPDAPDPAALSVTDIRFGPGPAPPDHPRVPLADLMAFAVTDLAGPGAPGSPG